MLESKKLLLSDLRKQECHKALRALTRSVFKVWFSSFEELLRSVLEDLVKLGLPDTLSINLFLQRSDREEIWTELWLQRKPLVWLWKHNGWLLLDVQLLADEISDAKNFIFAVISGQVHFLCEFSFNFIDILVSACLHVIRE